MTILVFFIFGHLLLVSASSALHEVSILFLTRFPVVISVGGMLETVAALVEFEVASGNFRTFGFLVVDVLLLIMVIFHAASEQIRARNKRSR